jgi:hypothetical protein
MPTIDDAQGNRSWTMQRILQPVADAALCDVRLPEQVDRWAADLQRRRDCLIDDHGQPGPYLRWLCLLRLVCERGGGSNPPRGLPWRAAHDGPAPALPTTAALFKDLWQAYTRAEPGCDAPRPPADWQRSAFYHSLPNNLSPAERFHKDDDPLYRALQQAWQEIRALDGLPPWPLARLMNVPCALKDDACVADALERLAIWMESDGQPICDDLSRLQAEHFATPHGSGRGAIVDTLVNALLDDGDGAQPIVNVHCDDGWTGLRALSTEVCLRLKQAMTHKVRGRRPALVYLPLRRLLDGGDGQRPNRGHLKAVLHRCLGAALHGDAGPGDDTAGNAAEADLRQLQSGLTSHRLIVVLDGVEVSSRPFNAVWDLLRNTDWVPFIRALVQPTDEGLRATGGAYRSRFLVLSNQPLDDLQAWMCMPSLALAPVTDRDEALRLMAQGSANDVASGLSTRLATAWPSPRPRPGTSREALCDLYDLDFPAARAAIEASAGLPAERRLALSRMVRDLGKQPSAVTLDLRHLVTWMEERPPRSADIDRQPAASTLVIELLAVSISGLRIDTLLRALERLESRAGIELLSRMLKPLQQALRNRRWVEGFAKGYRCIVEMLRDGDRLCMPPALRDFELNPSEADGAAGHENSGDLMFDLRNEHIRECILAGMLGSTEGTARFRLMSEVLAEEALAQATAGTRHAADEHADDPVARRRYVQTIFHGLMSLDPAELGEHDPRPTTPTLSVSGHALPVGAYRRFVYLYEFIYRRRLEQAPAWTLGRGLGQEDLRVALLTMFANPGWARRVLSVLHGTPRSQRAFEAFGAFGEQSARGFGRALQPTALHLHGALGADLFNALLHACLRGGRHRRYARRADVIAAQLALVRPQLMSPADAAHSRRSFTKIAIDALQTADELDAVRVRCREELASLGMDVRTDELERLGAMHRLRYPRKKAFENEVLRPVATRLCRSDPRGLAYVSDLLFRLAECLATTADWEDDPADLAVSQERYAHAYAVFWIADRVRSNAATLDDSAIQWPAVSARAMRYFVRVALKMAKLTALGASGTTDDARMQAISDATEFYGHARARIDVYTRHLSSYPLERLHGLLLLAAASRVRASMAASFGIQNGNDTGPEMGGLLSTSSHYLFEAWKHMVRLDFNPAIHKRFLLERIKTGGKQAAHRAASGQDDEARLLALIAARDRATLERISTGSPYWKKLLEGLGRSRASSDPQPATMRT